jgi:hypothetical protein
MKNWSLQIPKLHVYPFFVVVPKVKEIVPPKIQFEKIIPNIV